MSATVLSVTGLGKKYRGHQGGWRRMASFLFQESKEDASRWSLRNISFSARNGEVIAIIGQNGSGKSTLLKIIAGTSYATEGQVVHQGRVVAILELGMGFSPDLTGRQNVMHSATLMGRTPKEVADTIGSIEDFAEIGEYFDQPLRTYSSGMQARLAFALATAFPCDILMVDEVLSVGDSYFQHKSFDRIRQFKEQGTTILFVTHNMGDVRALCDRVLLLDKGEMLKDGAPDEVIDFYNAMIAAKENERLTLEQRRNKEGWLYTRSGNGLAAILDVGLFDVATGAPAKLVKVGQDIAIRAQVSVEGDVEQFVIGCMIRDRRGHLVWGTNTYHTGQMIPHLTSGSRLKVEIRIKCELGQGSYGISLAAHTGATHIQDNFDWIENVEVFDVINVDTPFFVGTSHLEAKFAILSEG